MEPTNKDRAQRGRNAARSNAAETGMKNDDPDSVLSDLLADLRHYAHEEGFDFEAAVQLSGDHFREECAEWNDSPENEPFLAAWESTRSN